jgi:hypothetical protein
MASAETYRENLFRLLGDREPLAVMSQTASTLTDIVRAHPVSVLRARPFEGKWTPNEIIGHLADGEWVYGYRLRLIVCEQNPAIFGTQQDFWVVRQHHNDREPSELVEMFRRLRELNLAMWRRVTPADLERTGQHNERGTESLAVMLRMIAGHDLSHLAQMARYIDATAQHPG